MALGDDAQGIRVLPPALGRRERLARSALQTPPHRLGQTLLAQVVAGVVSDAIGNRPRMQDLEEVDPTLAEGAGEPGEVGVTACVT
jgi:hypothetical protein